MQNLPAELCGGPLDGKYMLVNWHTIQIYTHSPPPIHYDFQHPDRPVAIHTGIYVIRTPIRPNQHGYYLYDWKGYVTIKTP